MAPVSPETVEMFGEVTESVRKEPSQRRVGGSSARQKREHGSHLRRPALWVSGPWL